MVMLRSTVLKGECPCSLQRNEVLDRNSVTVYAVPQVCSVKYHTKAFSTFHQINAFEEDGFLMLDMCCSDDGQAINNYLIQNLRKSGDALDEVSIIA